MSTQFTLVVGIISHISSNVLCENEVRYSKKR